MKYNLTLLKSIGRLLNTACVYLILFCVFLTIYNNGIVSPLYLIGIPLLLIGYLLIERYCYQPFLYLLLHALFLAPILLIPFPVSTYRYLYIAVFVAENVHGIRIWKQVEEKRYDEAPWPLFIIVGTIYIIVTAYHMENLSWIIYCLNIGLILIHFFRLSVEGLSATLGKTRDATSVPVNKIVITSFAMIVFISLAFFVTALFVRAFHLEQSVYAVGDLLLKLVKILIHFLLYIIAFIRLLFSSERQVEEPQPIDHELLEDLQEMKDPTLQAIILQTICIVLFLLLVIFILYKIIFRFIHYFLSRHAKDTDQIVTLKQNVRGTKTTLKKPSALDRLKAIFGADNAMKIRHAYRLKIKTYPKELYPKSNTPAETADNVKRACEEDISELTALYEKARYSKEEITIEEVKQGGVL